MYIIAGLGNPGLKYARTRHNLGFMTVDELASRLGIKVDRKRFRARIGEGFIAGHKVVLVKPQTYMNLSGESLREVFGFYKPEHDHLIVVYDDFDIEKGMLRIRPAGSAGTHNGMRSVVSCLGFTDFPRIRIGIGGHAEGDAIGHVIGRISKDEKQLLESAVTDAASACEAIITDGLQKAMNKYNGHR